MACGLSGIAFLQLRQLVQILDIAGQAVRQEPVSLRVVHGLQRGAWLSSPFFLHAAVLYYKMSSNPLPRRCAEKEEHYGKVYKTTAAHAKGAEP